MKENSTSKNTVVWIKDDLRLEDNPAINLALQTSDPEHIVIVRTSDHEHSHIPLTQRRIDHERAAINEMKTLLSQTPIRFVEAAAGAADVTKAILALNSDHVLTNNQSSDDIGYARDIAVLTALRQASITVDSIAVEGVKRGSGRRPGWTITAAADMPAIPFTKTPAAMKRLRTYLSRLPNANYRRDMWLPGPDATASSRLSVDLACGALSTDRVLHEIELCSRQAPHWQQSAYNQFRARIEWRRSFTQMMEDNVAAFPWGPMRDVRPDDGERMEKWLTSQTGYPLVDAAMKDLTETGWINFRLRHVLLSFAVDLLDLDFHKAGVALGSLFDDYYPGIHWPQVAVQSGMAKDRGPRVINPIKQAKELDPSGAYVRRILPYLKDMADEHIFEPWKAGATAPIVIYLEAARAARARYPSKKTVPVDEKLQ